MISALLNMTNELRADIMFSSNREGVGRITSWMYITWYVWWIYSNTTHTHTHTHNSASEDATAYHGIQVHVLYMHHIFLHI